ncbi:MAG: PEP-utilizing enzyme [Patescibacteria group bacterium]
MTSDILYALTSSHARARLLEYFVNFQSEAQFRELQQKLSINPRQLTLQLKKLKEISLIHERIEGKRKFYRANIHTSYFSSLQQFIKSLKIDHGEWFRWERAGTIHHLYIVLEAAMRPMYEYFRLSWPLTLIIFKGENALWCNRMKDLSNLGEQIIQWHQKTNAKKYHDDIQAQTKKLEHVYFSIQSADLPKLPIKQLGNLYQELHDEYTRWFALLWTTEPVAIRAEELLKVELKSVSEREFALLTSTTHISFTQEIEDSLQAIVSALRRTHGSPHDPRILAMIDAFQQNYFWMHNNYFETKVLQREHIILEVKKRLITPVKEGGYAHVASAQKLALMNKLKLGAHTRALIEISDHFIYLQDIRKKWMMKAAHYLELLLAEAGRRSHMSIHHMRYTLPDEFMPILHGHIPHVSHRMKNAMLVFAEGALHGKIFAGDQALREEQKYFPSNNPIPSSPHGVLKGRVACQGKAIGTVKVLMNPSEAYKVNHGDVLVTSMTSPDFITSIRKCVAIVTNEGGLTCHAAIISRELNIPCIIGTKNATQFLKDGDKVEVNADEGIVTVLE